MSCVSKNAFGCDVSFDTTAQLRRQQSGTDFGSPGADLHIYIFSRTLLWSCLHSHHFRDYKFNMAYILRLFVRIATALTTELSCCISLILILRVLISAMNMIKQDRCKRLLQGLTDFWVTFTTALNVLAYFPGTCYDSFFDDGISISRVSDCILLVRGWPYRISKDPWPKDSFSVCLRNIFRA